MTIAPGRPRRTGAVGGTQIRTFSDLGRATRGEECRGREIDYDIASMSEALEADRLRRQRIPRNR